MLRRLKLLVVLLTLSLVLAGCNRVGLAYRNLDVIIPWTLNDYLDMNAGQPRSRPAPPRPNRPSTTSPVRSRPPPSNCSKAWTTSRSRK